MNRAVSSLRDHLAATAVIAGIFAVSAVLAVISLAAAEGVVEAKPGSFRNEWANAPWWLAAFGLFLPVTVASHRRPRLAVAFLAAAVIPQFWVPWQIIERDTTAGQGDPLIGLGFLAPAFMTVIFGVSALAAALAGRVAPARTA
ncbi:hypothetical protein [Actinoplanes sp. DH11]|uniref:hypothetical protein n=1 Tax=Actinoplanes sp. DH11 TaxID=2857011 RepID=UPI001E40FE27|nr:hypothetical protein [Actinoplanes sp. DH11]